jgi:sodium/hydrogen antiporter
VIPPILFLAVVGLVYALVSKRLETTVVTAPLFFAGIGLLAGPALGLVDIAPGSELLVGALEAALVMVLFADASSMNMRAFRGELTVSKRLLGIGLPLTIVAGAMIAALLLPGIEPWQAALLGAILAPTDAALGQAVVANPRVPAVIRNALNVESGLNDGLALPFVSIFIAAGLAATGAESEIEAMETLVRALAGSTAIGLAIGVAGGLLLRAAVRRGYAAGHWQSIGLVSIAAASFLAADTLEASGFLSVWVAGFATGIAFRPVAGPGAFRLPEVLAEALVAIAFLLLGTALLGPVLARVTPLMVVYAVLSLTVVRMLPVAVSMLRSGFARPTILYLGWFGPRGLASIVFAGILVETALPGSSEITDTVLLTVALSIVAHGMTAAWGARRYAAWFERVAPVTPGMPEAAEVATPSRYPRGMSPS